MVHGSESGRSPVSARGEDSQSSSRAAEPLQPLQRPQSQGASRAEANRKRAAQQQKFGVDPIRPLSATCGSPGAGKHAFVVSRIIARRVASARSCGIFTTEDAWTPSSPDACKAIQQAAEVDFREGGGGGGRAGRAASPLSTSRPASRERPPAEATGAVFSRAASQRLDTRPESREGQQQQPQLRRSEASTIGAAAAGSRPSSQDQERKSLAVSTTATAAAAVTPSGPTGRFTKSDRAKQKEAVLADWAASVWGKPDDVDSQELNVEANTNTNSRSQAQAHHGRSGASMAVTLLQVGGPSGRGMSSSSSRKNPFVEYEDREKRLKDERKWLRQDASYMQQRTEELRKIGAQRRLHMRLKEPELQELSEAGTLYSTYGVKLLRKKAAKKRQAARAAAMAVQLVEEQAAAAAAANGAANPAAAKQGSSGVPGRSGSVPTMSRLQAMQRDIQDSSTRLYRAATTGRGSISSPAVTGSKAKKRTGFEALVVRADVFFEHGS
mmetsp:Transcript_26211/g.61172  ORF Transcript_26211/g.61172 Transcript_26211/m.61172 type:complete len:497 (-) Transcript_26211:175-1665(-)